MSIVANQVSAVSLIGAPAFVALREGGGLRWLQYELAVPLAMLLLMVVLLPSLRSVPGSSIYQFAEQRFGRPTRTVLALVFLVSRGLSLGVILYASAVVVAQVFGWSVEMSIIVIGLFSVLYTSLGGIIADIWSDVLQLVILWTGVIVSALYIVIDTGGAVFSYVPASRTRALVLNSASFTDGTVFSFWPMLFGGLFLYLSYYGCDQSQAQRLLAARDTQAARNALLVNGLLRFPLVLTYCVFGLLLAGLLGYSPEFTEAMRGKPADSLVPVFITIYLPDGLRGLLLAAILAAAMSSIDSALNSLAAITLEDIFGRSPSEQPVWLSRATSLAWGTFSVVAGLMFAHSGTGVLELINQVGSAFYGPVLAVFVLGTVTSGISGKAVIRALIIGLTANLALGRLAPGVSWLWWNPFGFLVTGAVALASRSGAIIPLNVTFPRRDTALLGGACVIIFALLAAFSAFEV
jgi:SSS family solute:Na+ symporter